MDWIWVLPACLARLKRVSEYSNVVWRNKFRWVRLVKRASNRPWAIILTLASNQVGLPAELKHINKRRKRN